jgi:hypothetical protein
MGLGCDALAGRLVFPAPATEPSARPELVATRRQVRGSRPLTVPKWAPAAAKWAAVILLTAATAIGGVFLYQKRLARAVTTGTVTLETTPSGLDVVLAGKSVGKTPLTTTLAAGSYDVQVGTAPNTRTIKVNVTAGTSVVQHVEIADALATAAVTTGGLHVQTEPSHLPVFIDGTNHGPEDGSAQRHAEHQCPALGGGLRGRGARR